jgi:hypothetical protein
MWRDNGFQSSTALASISEINVTDQTFDSCLNGNTSDAGTGQTSRAFFGTTNNWMEAGWMVKNSGLGGHRWWLFTEWGLNGTKHNQTPFDQFTSPSVPPACYQAGHWDYFEVEDEGGTTWSAFVDCEDGAGYRTLITYPDVTYSNGGAEGESFARGATTMTGDIHRNMQYEDLHYVLRSSTGATCRWDTSPYFNGQAVGATEFDTISPGSGMCGP